MEIGSFIELQFQKGLEYYNDNNNIARLNCGRCAIYHALRILNLNTIWLPYYECDTVRDFLKKKKINNKEINIKYYYIDKNFNPIDFKQNENEAVLFVNYYGIMSYDRMVELINKYSINNNVIIDNSQSFFSLPIDNVMNVYSARKFVGVPDGAYVIGPKAEKYVNEYKESYSSDTAIFMLERIEYGCEGKTYKNRQINEHKLDSVDIMKMSKLTHTILDGTDYNFIKAKRRENFAYAHDLFKDINKIDPTKYYDKNTIPMVYPLVVEDDNLLPKLQEAKHFQGHWWSYICEELDQDTFEYYLSRYVIPITIDQRYGKEELDYIFEVVQK